jgi:tetratricopeptide (TPR) repeat protein
MGSNPEAAGYPGNPSLPREVREKILSTFRHTLNLYHEGKADDCVIGCDFILKMDPRFTPARRLMDKAKNPAAAIDVAELEALVATTPTRQERVGGAQPEQQLVRAVESYNARDFDAAITAAEKVLAVLPGNRDALEILDKAASKKASQPLFEASRQKALLALDSGRLGDAKQELEKMRAYDPDHPAVALLERRIQPGAPKPPAPPASPKRTTDEISFDVLPHEPTIEFGGMPREPEIAFDNGATVALKLGAPPPPPSVRPAPPSASAPSEGLASLSLDSLSLDLPASGSPMASPSPASPTSLSLDDTSPGLHSRGSAAPPPPAGSPADFWKPGPPGMELEEVAAAPARPAPAKPAAPPPPPPAPEEDEADASEKEITTLLKQGDDAARRGNRQQAIEIWSRIFLIDINNSDAVTRIEKARQEMAEGNRVISDALKAGREKFESGDFTGAREHFLQVLALDENEATARFYIDRIEEELSRAASGQRSGSSAAGGRETASSDSFEDAAGAAPARTAKARSAPRGLPINARVLGIAAVAILATAIGAYFFVLRSPKSPPGSANKSGGAGASSANLAHARELLSTGKIGEARAELRKIPASNPDYAEARRMLSEMEGQTTAAGAAAAPGGPAVSVEGGGAPPPPVVAENDPANFRAAGEKALSEKRYIDALKAFNQAKAAFKNDPTFSQAMGLAADKVATLAPAVKLYNEAEYETVIPMLWRIHQEDRDNQDARSYLLRAYYNQGITQLQNQLYPKAIQSFDEALAIDPKDQEIIRHHKFAEHYLKGDLDLMGRIYVRHLNHRP